MNVVSCDPESNASAARQSASTTAHARPLPSPLPGRPTLTIRIAFCLPIAAIDGAGSRSASQTDLTRVR